MQVNGSASGGDDIGPDLLQRYDVTGLGGRADHEAASHAISTIASVVTSGFEGGTGLKNSSDFIFCSFG